MKHIDFETALLPHGWASNVRITIDADGNIDRVSEGVSGSRGSRRACVLPGVPNLHSHAHQRAMAGLAEFAGQSADSFWSWREVMYRHVSKITPEQLQSIAAQLYVEMLKSGYTSVAEFQYLHHDPSGKRYANPAEMSLRVCEAARHTGIGMTCLPVLYRFGGFGDLPPDPGQARFVNEPDDYLEIAKRVGEYTRSNNDQHSGVAPHSLRAINRSVLREVLDDSSLNRLPVHIHIAEQQAEVRACLDWHSARPVEWLLDNFDPDARWCLVHATHMTDDETRRLAGTGAVAGLCPTTEANLGDGLFNATPFIDCKGNFGIGSDSQISVSPVEELRWLEYGQRLVTQRRNVITGNETLSTGRFLFDKVLSAGAQACGRKIGKIAAGYRADLIVLDTQHPILYNRQHDRLLDSWIFSGNSGLVTDVFVGGRKVIQGGVHPDETSIRKKFETTLKELAD